MLNYQRGTLVKVKENKKNTLLLQKKNSCVIKKRKSKELFWLNCLFFILKKFWSENSHKKKGFVE